MSVDEQTASSETLDERVARLERQMQEAGSKSQTAIQRCNETDDRVDELEQTVADLKDEKKALQSEVEKLRELGGLLQAARQSSATSKEQRYAIYLNTIYNEAQQGAGADEEERATLTATEAKTAVQGAVSRSMCYEDLKDLAAALDTDALYFVSEDRSSKQNSRLVLDLTKGDLPEMHAGFDVGGEV